MVTAMNGVITLRANSGQQVAYNIYSSDVLGAFLTVNKNGAAVAGSQNFFNAPFDGYIDDISTPATNTVTTNFIIQVQDNNVGLTSVANTLNTLTNRAIHHVAFRANQKITILQQ